MNRFILRRKDNNKVFYYGDTKIQKYDTEIIESAMRWDDKAKAERFNCDVLGDSYEVYDYNKYLLPQVEEAIDLYYPEGSRSLLSWFTDENENDIALFWKDFEADYKDEIEAIDEDETKDASVEFYNLVHKCTYYKDLVNKILYGDN